MYRVSITDSEFAQFQKFIFDAAGITMSPAKKALVGGRLAKRIEHCGAASYGEYYRMLMSGHEETEKQMAIDLLTTNETYFFREPKHFDFLKKQAIAAKEKGQPFRVWSAACSSGEEPYSIAMVLADCLEGRPWEIVASDISTRILQRARTGHYPLERTTQIPKPYLQRFCLKGVGPQEGTLLVEKNLRSRVQFTQVNLDRSLPQIGSFDVVFLRNVMIYFNTDTKRGVVQRILSAIKPGGHLLIGHSESLNDIADNVINVAPSIFRKP